ncbi:MAG TPA: hypothetical protein VD862_01640 [Candidatus Paceibacterota bacterium]|nr:hypothetical protein [Candidatus Paceibacterota bacterium]
MKVTMRTRSDWQKPDCLFCTAEATLEAVCGSANIRCCGKEICRKMARQLAEESAEALARALVGVR